MWRFDRMETNLVLLLELFIIFVLSLAVTLILSTEVPPPVWAFVSSALALVVLSLAVLFASLVYRPERPLLALILALSCSGAVSGALISMALVLVCLLSSTQMDEGQSAWVLAHYLEPGFAFGSPQVLHLAQLVVLIAVVPLIACGALLLLAQLSQASREAASQELSPMLLYAKHTLANLNPAPWLRATAIFGGSLQDYYTSMLSRACDEVGKCIFNTANLADIVRNDDVIVQTSILLLFGCVLEFVAAASASRVLLEEAPKSKFDNTDGNRIGLVTVRAISVCLALYCALVQSTQYLPGCYSLHVVLSLAMCAFTAAETLSQLAPDALRADVLSTLASKQTHHAARKVQVAWSAHIAKKAQ